MELTVQETTELTVQEMEILAILAINAIESGEFGPGVWIHPTLVNRLQSAHAKLIRTIKGKL